MRGEGFKGGFRARACDLVGIIVLPGSFLLFALTALVLLHRSGIPGRFVLALGLAAVLILLLIRRSCVRCRKASAQGAQLYTIMRSLTTEGIVLLDAQRRITACNDSVQRLFGWDPDELIGHTSDLLYDDRSGGTPGGIAAALQDQGFHLGQANGRRKDGSTMPLEISTSLYHGGSGAVLVMRDITARLQAEQDLRAAKQEAEGALARLRHLEDLRDGLTHMVIHDMRTPMQVLLANSQLISRFHGESLHAEAKDLLGDVIAQTRILIQMSQAALDVSRIESGRMPLQKATFDLGVRAADLAGDLEPILRYHRVSIERAGAAPVLADPDVIDRVLANLLGNAVKHTPHGAGIALRIGRRAEGRARVEIADEGPGIAPEDQPHLFEKYPRVSRATGRRQHSTGLGLAFCKLAVEAHGGTIGLESGPQGGSTFWFELPAS